MVGEGMKKKALRKDFFVEVRKSRNRFLSILFIVALGVSFYSGIQSAAPDMKRSGDVYFDREKLMDLKVVSTLGLTEEDLLELEKTEGIETAEGAYMTVSSPAVLVISSTWQTAAILESASPRKPLYERAPDVLRCIGTAQRLPTSRSACWNFNTEKAASKKLF